MAADSRNSLLAHVAWKFPGQTETLATEALGYILSRSPAAREALRETLQTGGADVAPLPRVATEVIGDQGERLDLVAFDEHDSERVLIEVKFWAGLTDHQPNTYLDRLPKDEEPAVLLFVAPELRLVTLWAELHRRAETRFGLAVDMGTEGLRSATMNGSPHRLMLTSWRTLLNAMSTRAGIDGETSAERDILQLSGLCERQDTKAFLPIRPEELAPAFPRRMLDMQRLVKDATARGHQGGFVTIKGLHVTPQAYGYGRYLRLGKEGAWAAEAWFGVHYELWARQQETPLWLHFTGGASLAKKKLGKRNYGFTLPVSVEYDAVLDSVIKELSNVADDLSG